jgi:hypothetical protein
VVSDTESLTSHMTSAATHAATLSSYHLA